MTYAGRLPIKTFTQVEWLAMPVFSPAEDGDFPPESGFWRYQLRSKTIVFWFDWEDIKAGYMVRPVVRVPMGRAS